jgi:hypothetical protein
MGGHAELYERMVRLARELYEEQRDIRGGGEGVCASGEGGGYGALGKQPLDLRGKQAVVELSDHHGRIGAGDRVCRSCSH